MPDPNRQLNAAVAAARAAAEQHLDALEATYETLLRSAGRAAAWSFRQQTTLTAAVNPWEPPATDLVDGEALEQDAAAKLRAQHRRILRAVTPAQDLGVSWTIDAPSSQALLAKVALRLGSLGDAIRQQVSESIQAGYSAGWSVDQTAKAIVSKVDDVAPVRAAALARTDLNALSNGASLSLAAQVDGVDSKSWKATGDDRTRETHAQADGQTVPINQPFTVGDEQAQYPADPDLSDEEAFNCRCTIVYGEPLTAATAAPDFSALAMVALFPRPAEAEALAIDGGHDPDSMHVTMLFLGDAASVDVATLEQVIDRVARTMPPLEGTVGGCALFAAGDLGHPSILLPDVKGLAALQQEVERSLRTAGIESPSEHGFLPHLTVTYADEPQIPSLDAIGQPLHFDAITLDVGDRRVDFPLNPALTAGGDMEPTLDDLSADELRDLAARATSRAHNLELSTIVLTDLELTAAADGGPTGWRATLLVEDEVTEDGRLLLPDSITWRQLPLTLGLMLETPHSYETAAPTCGRIDMIWRAGSAIQASGVFTDNSDDETLAATGRQAVAAIGERVVRGISVDLAVLDGDEIFIPEVSLDTAGEDELPPEVDENMGEVIVVSDDAVIVVEETPPGRWVWAVKEGVVGSACVVPFPAISQATIEVVTAAGGFRIARSTRPLFTTLDGLEASAAPLKPPADWFADPSLSKPTPLTVTDDGRVYGHIALWSACHTGYTGRCVPPPRSGTAYSHFHVGELELDDGKRVPVGKITIAAGHAGTSGVSAAQARAHYDNSATVAAFVRAGEDRFGPWVAGALRSDLPAELRRDLMANPPSGDWRNNEMIAVHAVPTPGFPVLRASALDDDGEEQETALIMASPFPDVVASTVPEELGPLSFLRPGRRSTVAA